MGSIKEKIGPILRKRSVGVLVLSILVFAAAILLLFVQEKRHLDEEFQQMITDSLNIHIRSNVLQIDQAITAASDAMEMAGAMLRLADDNEYRAFLDELNSANPAYVISYASGEEVAAGALSALVPLDGEDAYSRLLRGEKLVGAFCRDQSLAGQYFSVIIPLDEQGHSGAALYTHIQVEGLLAGARESAVYQDVQSSFITGDGDIFFNTYAPEQSGNLFANLAAYGLSPEDIDRIAAIIDSPDIDSATFIRNGEVYFVSAAELEHNSWRLVSFVRGPDVLLHSEQVFLSVIRTGAAAILLTAALVCAVFIMLLFSRRKLEEEQLRSHLLAQRLKAMFDQHSALKIVFDAVTGIILETNPAILNYFGYAREEVLGQNINHFNLLPAEILAERINAESKGGLLFSAAPHRLKSGETRLFDVYASVIRDGESRLFYAIFFDVTDRESYRNQLLQEKELLRTTLQSIGDGVVTTDNLGLITGLNNIGEQITGWDKDTAMGKSFAEVFVLRNEETGEPVENPIQKVLDSGLIIGLANHTELENRRGEYIPIADSAAPIIADDGKTFGVVMVFRDVSDEKEHNRQIEYLSYHDALTGLYNRHYLEEAIARLEGPEHLPVAVIIADVNGLKITNDVFGHKAGDALLKNVADLMKSHCKAEAVAARWGGDEFMILMPGTSLETAERVIREIKDTPIFIEGSSLTLSLSLGCACKDREEGSIRAAMLQGEKNMYQQKLLEGKSYRNAIISTLLATLYEKSNETEAHSKRLETYCHAIGKELRLSSKEMDELSLLALLHDIGKVSINPSILQKPGLLTPEEWDEMKCHPEIGYRIAQATPELASIADLILSHHERWDGQGYPRGLREEEIPLACRILAVVDAFDAMTNHRVYRQAMSKKEALMELRRNAGKQFDPLTASLLIEIITSEEECLL